MSEPCLHLDLRNLADTMFKNFQSFKDGARFYRCAECGQMFKVTPIEITAVKP